MNIVVLNGSPRQGNTDVLVDAFMNGANMHHIDYFDLSQYHVSPCEACNVCEKLVGLCKHKDDTNEILQKMKAADAIVFASPVYWWGISAQLKAVIDKMYVYHSVDYSLPNKKIGLINVGGDSIDGLQYKLISDQYKCICQYLKWTISFDVAFSAYNIGDIEKDVSAIETCRSLYEKFSD